MSTSFRDFLPTLRKNDELIEITRPVYPRNVAALVPQADRDVLIVSNARAKPLDHSLPPTNGIPTTAKMGVDATIPDNVSRERYQRVLYFNKDKIKLKDFLGQPARKKTQRKEKNTNDLVKSLADGIFRTLFQRHKSFGEILNLFSDKPYRSIATAIGMLRQRQKIEQDKQGKYQIKEAH